LDLYWLPIGGRFECVRFSIEVDDKLGADIPPEQRLVTAQLVRSIPVGSLIEETRQRTGRDAASIAEAYHSAGDIESAQQERELAEQFRARRAEGHRPRLGNDHYRAVAEVYASAWRSGSAPTQSIERYFDVPHSTAARWVQEARRRGFLGQTQERKPGGIEPPKPKEDE